MSLKPKIIDFDSAWDVLLETVRDVIALRSVPRPIWSERIHDVYHMCVASTEPLGDRLYENIKNFLEEHVNQLCRTVSSSIHGEETLLSACHASWLTYNRGSEFLDQLFMYLNIQHLKQHKSVDLFCQYGMEDSNLRDSMLEIRELGLDVWKRNMIDPIIENLVEMLLSEINIDRCGGSPNQTVIYDLVQSFVTCEGYKTKNAMELYEANFEAKFLLATGVYYQREASKLLQECDCATYMGKAIQKQAEENQRCRKFLHVSSYEKVTLMYQQKMLVDHLPFLHGECKSMVKHEKRKDLRNMYTLLKPVEGGLQEMVQIVENHIKSKGKEAIDGLTGDNVNLTPSQRSQIPVQFVENLLRIHQSYLELIKDVFNSDPQFVAALDKACSAVINQRPSQEQRCQSPELLVRYCDALLKKGASKGISDMDDKLSSIITVFRYLGDKDEFQQFYSRMLAKRLIHGLSVSMDSEEGMISRLKQSCGFGYTTKLEKMLKDVKICSDFNNDFGEYLRKENTELGISFSTLILQTAAWPFSSNNLTPFAIPQQLEKSVHMFEKYYQTRFHGRKLTWIHHLCTAELKLCYLKKTYVVITGTFQMAILLLFEKTNSLSYREIQESTRLTTEQLNRNMRSLTDAKLLLPSQAEFCDQTDFKLNMDFSNKRTKFKITASVQKENKQEVVQTRQNVELSRKLNIDAAIVRIMKSRKVLKHNVLIEEVINQLKANFPPSIPMIKKCIEGLIEKDYLERAANVRDEYNYVA